MAKLTYWDFAKKIKEKYPEYASQDDLTLAKKVIQKYPEYKDSVSFDVPSNEIAKTLPGTKKPSASEAVLNSAAPVTGITPPAKPSEYNPHQTNDRNIFFKGLDVLNAGSYGGANMLYQAIENKDYNLAKNFYKGLSLKEKRSVGDILEKKFGVPDTIMGKIAQGALGFAGDIAVDPLTYTGVGLVGKGGKLIKDATTAERLIEAGRAAGKAAETKKVLNFGAPLLGIKNRVIPGSEKVIDPIARGVTKVTEGIRKAPGISTVLDSVLPMLSTKFRPSDVDPVKWEKLLIATEKAKNMEKAYRGEALSMGAKILREAKKLGLSDDEIGDITNQIESKAPAQSSLGKMALGYSNRLTDAYKNVGESGKKIIQEEGYHYLPHVLESIPSTVKKDLGLGALQFTTKSPSDVGRSILKYTDEAGNDMILNASTGILYADGKKVGKIPMKQLADLKASGAITNATIKEINQGIGATLFSESLPKLMAIQGMRTGKVIAGDEFFKLAAKLGSKKDIDPKTGEQLFESTAPELAGLYFPQKALERIDNTYKMISSEDQINRFLKSYDAVQNAWKAQATFWSPAFHARNLVSNMYLNSLAGVMNPLDYFQAMRLQMLHESKLSSTEKQLLKDYRSQGLGSVGQVHGDIAQSIDKQLSGVFDQAKKGNVIGAISKAGSNTGSAVEENAKLAHFIAKKKEGYSNFDAANSVKNYLFDYEDNTQFEKGFLKRVMPFYTFPRKNLPVQIASLIKNPTKPSSIVKLKNNIEVMTGDSGVETILPSWLKDAAPLYVGEKDGIKRYMKLEGFLPVTDLLKISSPGQEFLKQVTPIIKAPTEFTANRKIFGTDPYYQTKGEMLTQQQGLAGIVPGVGYGEKKFLGADIPGRLEYLGRLWRPLNDIDAAMKGIIDDKDGQSAALKFFFGNKTYKLDPQDLLKRYKKMSTAEAEAIAGKINDLKREALKNPEKSDAIWRDIEMLRDLKIKSKQKGLEDYRNQREKVKS